MRIKYEAPLIEVVEIEIEDVILTDSGVNKPKDNGSSLDVMETAIW